jgi:hypothetical protein
MDVVSPIGVLKYIEISALGRCGVQPTARSGYCLIGRAARGTVLTHCNPCVAVSTATALLLL